MPDCLIGFGANLGDPQEMLTRVAKRIEQVGIDILGISNLIKTTAIGGDSNQPDYFNAVIRIKTASTAVELIRFLLRMEEQLGRVRGVRWESRPIDLDLLLFGDEVIQLVDEKLDVRIPHPRMSFRRFVLQPAAAVAPDMMHPVIGATIQELLDRINRKRNLILIVGPDSNDSQMDQAISQLTAQTCFGDYEFLWAHSPQDFERYSTSAKLLIRFQKQPGELQNGNHGELDFRGPTLILNQDHSDQWVLEITAAIDAMRPL